MDIKVIHIWRTHNPMPLQMWNLGHAPLMARMDHQKSWFNLSLRHRPANHALAGQRVCKSGQFGQVRFDQGQLADDASLNPLSLARSRRQGLFG